MLLDVVSPVANIGTPQLGPSHLSLLVSAVRTSADLWGDWHSKKGCMYPFKYAWCSWVYCVLCIHDHAYNCISCKFTIWLYGTNLFILHGFCWPMVFFHCRFWFGFLGSFLQGGTSLSTSCPGCLPLPCHLGKQRFSLHSGHLCCCCVAANFDWGIPGYKTGMSLMIIIRPVTSEDIIMWTKYWWTKSPLHWLCGGDDTGFS